MLKMEEMRFPKEIILVCSRWYAAHALSYRNLEQVMQKRGVSVDHSTKSRWTIRFLHRMYDIESGEEVATTELVRAHIDTEARKAVPFPDDIVKRQSGFIDTRARSA